MSILDRFEYPWEVFRVVVEGISILDIPRLQIRSLEEATNFIRAYGFDPGDAESDEILWKFFDEAVSFIENSLNDPKYPKIPEHLRSRSVVRDLRRLLLIASESVQSNPHSDQIFACAILRVMHVLIHLANDPRLRFFDEVQSQIFDRLDRYLSVDPVTGVTYLGLKETQKAEWIKLLFFKRKDRKDREREIIKLLHKNDSLVEEIHDRIGFRLVTETKYDAARVLRLLLDRNIISIANIRPGRSRNRLINLKRFQFEIDRIAVHLKKHHPDNPAPYVDKLIRRLESRIGFSRLTTGLMNPHTSEHFRAIQFTCREMVKVKNSLFSVYERTKQELSSFPDGERSLQRIFPNPPKHFEYIFFPYEIQIMDIRSYADSIFGKSNHDEYRRKQLEAARVRVFGKALKQNKEKR